MLFFGEAQVFNSPANTHSSWPSQVHFLGITCLWPTFKLYNKCSAFSSAYYCSNPYHSAPICTVAGEQSHTWQLVSSERQGASLEGDHPPSHPSQQYLHSEMALTGAQLSFHASIQSLFCSALSPEPGPVVKDFILFSFSGTICFEEHSCGSCQAPFQGEKIQVALFPLSLPNVYIPADTVVSQEGAVAGGHGLCSLAIVTWHWA